MADGVAASDALDGVDLALFAGASAGTLPTRLQGCAYDAEDQVWVPKRSVRYVEKPKRSALLYGFSYKVEKARSGASGCKRCGEKIPRGELRVGYPVKDHRGDYGAVPVWLHVACSRQDPVLAKLIQAGDGPMESQLLGYAALAAEERTTFHELFSRTAASSSASSAAASGTGAAASAEGGGDDAPPPPAPAVPRRKTLQPHPRPATLQVEMLPFQAEGLGWMLAREGDEATRGGVLADEMGMGKTLQMISVMLAGRSDGPNLVVCPAAAMLQWRNEIVRFVQPGSLSVELYYGFGRKQMNFNGKNRLVVLTTYQTLEADYRQQVNRYKVECQWCGRLFLKSKLAFHQKYFCGPDAERTEKQSKQEKKTDLKDQAVKRMKIGGTETEITLNPLTSIRSCTMAALRTRRNAKGPVQQAPKEHESEQPQQQQSTTGMSGASDTATPETPKMTTPRVLPFPASVLPDEARAKLGHTVSTTPPGLVVAFEFQGEVRTVRFTRKPLGIVVDQRDPLVITTIRDGQHAKEVGVQPGFKFKSIDGIELGGRTSKEVSLIMGKKIASLPSVEGAKAVSSRTPDNETPKTPGKFAQRQARCRGRGVKRKAADTDDGAVEANEAASGSAADEALASPPALPLPQRRWGRTVLVRGQQPTKEDAPAAALGPSWGGALRAREGAAPARLIRLEGEDSDSELELVAEMTLKANGASSSAAEGNGAAEGAAASAATPDAAESTAASAPASQADSVNEGQPAAADGAVPSCPDAAGSASGEGAAAGSAEEAPAADGGEKAVAKAKAKGRGGKAKSKAKSKAKAKAGADAENAAAALPPRPDSDEDELAGAEDGKMDLSQSPLFSTMWGRVILDEAHRIKGRTNNTAQAAFELRAKTRWCLSGTPLQNRVGEVYSIIRFLRFYPYAHYFCSKKGCQCTSLHYRFCSETAACKKCGHTKMQHRSYFAQTVSNPIKKFGFVGLGRTAMEALRSDVLDRILLRRTKQERHDDLQLPPMHIAIRRDALSAEESDFYKAMYMNSLTKFDTYVESGTVLHNYAHVFDLIMRLRQAVDHPYLIVHGSLRTESGPIPTRSRSEIGAGVCALCQDDFDDLASRVISQCGHAFHRDCVADYLEQAPELASGGIGCPTCFAPLTVNLEAEEEDDEAGRDGAASASSLPAGNGKKNIMQRIKTSEFKSSTKIEALMQEIKSMLSKDSSSKALVFSQFTTFLEIIEWRMKREGVSCAKLLGSMPVTSKSNIIISFQTDPTLKVLLISLKAGGEGLNLQAADHIFLMDPWWNPASELQAIQRAHRIGQTRPVRATRFVATGTIEEKIIELQQKKQDVFDCSVGNSNSALQRLTGEDIQFLFSQ